nr:DUF4065 domain-containing protein [Methylobacterium sp. OTU13CASTA1]
MPAPYQANDIAAWFLGNIDREAGDAITHLKLQKLVYYAQAWSLALRDRPLFDEDMQAWAHGPVADSVYQIYRDSGWHALPVPEHTPALEQEDVEHLSTILQTYGDFSAKHLERMTHAEDPWLEARGDLPDEARCRDPIHKETMARFYRELYEQTGDGETQSA